jgi:hypothetical protein
MSKAIENLEAALRKAMAQFPKRAAPDGYVVANIEAQDEARLESEDESPNV